MKHESRIIVALSDGKAKAIAKRARVDVERRESCQLRRIVSRRARSQRAKAYGPVQLVFLPPLPASYLRVQISFSIGLRCGSCGGCMRVSMIGAGYMTDVSAKMKGGRASEGVCRTS